jgi:hypothetical protein
MFGFIKKLLSIEATTHRDVEMPCKSTSPINEWYVPQMEIINTQLVYNKSCCDEPVSLTYMGEKNRLELFVGGEGAPVNITPRVQTTVNNRLKKAGEKVIPVELFDLWEAELIGTQGKGKNTYASKRIKTTSKK